jgi:hypothetical protein
MVYFREMCSKNGRWMETNWSGPLEGFVLAVLSLLTLITHYYYYYCYYYYSQH